MKKTHGKMDTIDKTGLTQLLANVGYNGCLYFYQNIGFLIYLKQG
jgi:hypothetical protein